MSSNNPQLLFFLPGGFLLQAGYAGHVEHDPEEKQRLIAKLVQLLLEGFLQLHPTLRRSLGLPLEPQAEVGSLKPGGEDKTRQTIRRNVEYHGKH